VEPLLLAAIVEDHIEAPRHGDDELVQLLVGVASPLGSFWHVINIIDAAYLEGDVTPTLDEGQVSAGIMNPGEVDELTLP
jgi:hypothetical protein